MTITKRMAERQLKKTLPRFNHYKLQGDMLLGYCDNAGCYIVVIRDEKIVQRIKIEGRNN